ncbi:MFS transporter [Serratia fonticola]|nr:MFS transporter [Serratia fonticola]
MGNFIIPFMILLLTQKLGYSTTIAGGLAMGITGLFLIGNLIGGKISDSFGHKKTMVWGEILGSLVLLVSGFFAEWHIALPILLFASYLFYGIAFPASNALVADISSPENRNAVMSLSYLAYNLGSGIGPVLAGYLFWNHTAWVFWGNGIAGLIGALIVLFGVSNYNTQFNNSEHSELEKATTGSVWQVFLKRPHLLIFGILCTFLWFSLNQMTMTTPLYLSHIYDKKGPVLYGQLMTFASILVVIITPIIIRLTAKIDDIKSLAFGGFTFAFGYFLVLSDSSISIQFLAWFFLAAGEVLLLTKEGVYLANNSPSSHRGRISGILTTMRSFVLMPMYIVMGAYIESFGYVSTWLLIIIASMLTGLMFWLFSSYQRINIIKR